MQPPDQVGGAVLEGVGHGQDPDLALPADQHRGPALLFQPVGGRLQRLGRAGRRRRPAAAPLHTVPGPLAPAATSARTPGRPRPGTRGRLASLVGGRRRRWRRRSGARCRPPPPRPAAATPPPGPWPGTTSVRAIWPRVRVPVLSNTTVVMRRVRSRTSTLLKDAEPAAAGADHDGGRASPSAHGQAMINTATPAISPHGVAAKHRPAGEGEHGHGHDQRDEHRRDAVGQPLEFALAGLGLFHQPDDLGQGGVGLDRGRPHRQTPLVLTVAPATRSPALSTGTLSRSASTRRPPGLEHLAVDRDLPPGGPAAGRRR